MAGRKPKYSTESERYEAVKDRAREYAATLARQGSDICEALAIGRARINWERRDSCARDLARYLRTYYPASFFLPWSPDHDRAIAKAQTAVLEGGLFAQAMPRGSGKTTILEGCCTWAVLYGHAPFVAMFGPEATHGEKLLESIKVDLETNELLCEDFPDACIPIRELEGKGQKRPGQHVNGERTRIGWTKKEVVLPTVPAAKSATSNGAVLRASGITASFRGMKHKRADGSVIRPKLVFVDDIQTEKSADSPRGCEVRERIVSGAILGLAGPGVKISGLLSGTVLRNGDALDKLLDPKLHPEWHGERVSALKSFPANMQLWRTYGEILADSQRAGEGSDAARNFYLARRAEMDAGASVYWPERHNEDEASAVENLMRLYLQDEDAFHSEMQNRPKDRTLTEGTLTVEEICSRLNGLPRGVVPMFAAHLVSMIDVQADLLYYAVLAVGQDYTGAIVDYGCYPEQSRSYWSLKDAHPKLGDVAPGAGLEAAILAGLKALTATLFGREWTREGGSVMRLERCLIDANWGQSTDLVYDFCRRAAMAGQLLPSHGKYVSASSTPIAQYATKQGERTGNGWRIGRGDGRRAIQHVLFDSNFHKSLVAERFRLSVGDPGGWTLWGDKIREHRMFAEHLTAEYSVRVEAKGRTVDEWKVRPNRENHFLDCAVGCAVAASILGVSITGEAKPSRKRVDWGARQRESLQRQRQQTGRRQ